MILTCDFTLSGQETSGKFTRQGREPNCHCCARHRTNLICRGMTLEISVRVSSIFPLVFEPLVELWLCLQDCPPEPEPPGPVFSLSPPRMELSPGASCDVELSGRVDTWVHENFQFKPQDTTVRSGNEVGFRTTLP